jgi:sulfoquinovose isomerase
MTWLTDPAHRRWLEGETDRLLEFSRAARHPAGGFAWLDERGRPMLDQPVELWLTCRMTHVFALGQLLGRPGCGPLVDHGVQALQDRLRDLTHGGWFAAVGEDGVTDSGKETYGHAFVVLAASSATAAGHLEARRLLDDALTVMEERLWSESDGMVVDRCDEAFTTVEPYRGVNANMHTVEAFLAASDVTGDPLWRARALRITERVLGFARDSSWRIPEHYDEGWHPQPGYNDDKPRDRFRPYGATVGHAMEWARLALNLRAALGDEAPDWLLPSARSLFERAVADGWAVDGSRGFVYTTDWDGTPVVRHRMHWVAAEATAAAAVLHAVTGDPSYASWYETWWDHIDLDLRDRDGGSWWHELDGANQPSSTVWSGKPDTYHALQATLVPRLPAAPSLATALAHGRLDH